MVDLGFDGARGVEGLGSIGLELFNVVHVSNRKLTSYCSMWNMLDIRQIGVKNMVLFRSA
jgi:hypothetical protein